MQTHSHLLGLEATAIFLHSQDFAKLSITIHKWSITVPKDKDNNTIACLAKPSQGPAELPLVNQVSVWEYEPTMPS